VGIALKILQSFDCSSPDRPDHVAIDPQMPGSMHRPKHWAHFELDLRIVYEKIVASNHQTNSSSIAKSKLALSSECR
jgi:hypothetical protein